MYVGDCMYVDGHEVDVQYSNWQSGYPYFAFSSDGCVVVTWNNEWLPYSCNKQQSYVCQSQYRDVLNTSEL